MSSLATRLRAFSAALVLLVAPSTAQQTPPDRVVNGQIFEQWRVACQAIAVNETACGMIQTLTNTDTGRLLVEFQAVWNGGENPVVLVARAPVGVHLPSGFSIGPEGVEDRQEFEWQTCGAQLCEARLSSPFAVVEALERGTPLIVAYRPAPGAEPLVFRADFTGLAAGLSALDAAKGGN